MKNIITSTVYLTTSIITVQVTASSGQSAASRDNNDCNLAVIVVPAVVVLIAIVVVIVVVLVAIRWRRREPKLNTMTPMLNINSCVVENDLYQLVSVICICDRILENQPSGHI